MWKKTLFEQYSIDMCELTVSLTQSGCRVLNYSWPTSITERILSYILTQWQLLMRFWCSGKFSWVNCNPMKASLSTDYSLLQQKGGVLFHCCVHFAVWKDTRRCKVQAWGKDWALTCDRQDGTDDCMTI